MSYDKNTIKFVMSMLREGHSITYISETTHIHRHTISVWEHKYQHYMHEGTSLLDIVNGADTIIKRIMEKNRDQRKVLV